MNLTPPPQKKKRLIEHRKALDFPTCFYPVAFWILSSSGSQSWVCTRIIWRTSSSAGDGAPHPEFHSVCLGGRGPGISISNQIPGHADASGPGTSHWEPLLFTILNRLWIPWGFAGGFIFFFVWSEIFIFAFIFEPLFLFCFLKDISTYFFPSCFKAVCPLCFSLRDSCLFFPSFTEM